MHYRKSLRIQAKSLFPAKREMRLETPRLIIEWNGEAPTYAMCSACRAIFPTVERNGTEANKRLLEITFERHVKAEHQSPPSKTEQVNGRREP